MNKLTIKGATENNLKNIDVEIPHRQFTVITGLSGSGKSSLIRDVLQREGQRMYLETFSAYNRSRLGKIRPAKVKGIAGLLPVISVGQTHVQANRRSTAGTFSDVSPLLRQLFARFNDQKIAVPRASFSFNSNKGWCPQCKGLGIEEFIDVEKLVEDAKKSLRQGALVITLPTGYTIYSQVTIDELEKVCTHHGFSVDTPWENLTPEQQNVVLNGSTEVKVLYGKHSLESRMKWTGMTARPREEGYYKGIIPVMEDILQRDRNDNILRFVSARVCSVCMGERLQNQSRMLTWQGLRFPEIETLSFQDLLQRLQSVESSSKSETMLVDTLIEHIEQLCRLSVGHIAPGRLSETLSQGELRRMRLSQLTHSGLTGVLYLFDEPSIGLHRRDVGSLIDTFYKLVKKGNTVVVVEHNEAFIQSAQHLIELGPGAGKYGGELIYSGSPDEYLQKTPKNGLLKNVLSDLKTESASITMKSIDETFSVKIEAAHNIHNQTFTFAKKKLNVITGVSGAGKSTLVDHGLLQTKAFETIIHIDQKPIGRTSRSNPATYTGLFDPLRKLFAGTPEAKAAGLKTGHFSFNNKEGQCEACQGTGVIKTGMHIFEDLVQECPVCKGKRYNNNILTVKWNHKTISEILEMSIDDAAVFFSNEGAIVKYLHAMQQFGLGYLHLGQSSTTLSGGEAQRIKLAASLHTISKQPALFVLDEPTTGLHHADVEKLVEALRLFISNGHTVILVEHDLQIIKNADWIVDIGPEGGTQGGKCLFCGSAQQFFTQHISPTTDAIKTKPQKEPKTKTIAENGIHLKGICTNNLKNIDLRIPTGQLVAFTGMSGSGKTSLLIDTIYSEGQRLFTENMSSYRRLQIKHGTSADVQKTISIMPTVAVTADEQKPDIRSTLATLSGTYDLLRLLYARFATHPQQKSATASDFSLVNEYAVCKSCEGTGFQKKCLPGNIISDQSKPLLDRALTEHKTVRFFTSSQNKYLSVLETMAKANQIDLRQPWNSIAQSGQQKILHGTGSQKYKVVWQFERKNNKGNHQFDDVWPGLCNMIEAEFRMHYPSVRGKNALELLSDVPCETCNGFRLNETMLQFTFEGMHMGQMLQTTVHECFDIVTNSQNISSSALKQQLTNKLQFLIDAGLQKLTLQHPALWLSTGESKWVKLSSVLSSSLSGMCIILDEPFAGIDANGRQHLAETLKRAKAMGNTILVSDHCKELIEIADRIIELGPDSGENGGEIVADTTPDIIMQSKAPIAKKLLQNNALQRQPSMEQPVKKLTFENCEFHEARINLIIGKVGSGKSIMLRKIKKQSLVRWNKNVIFAQSKNLSANKNSSIGTRTNIMNELKKQFAQLPESKQNKVKEADFGFNNKTSQCSVCKGTGLVKTNLDFLPDVSEICSECNGKRYVPELLNYHFQNKNIAEWLNLSIEELQKQNFWTEKTQLDFKLLTQVGLSYLSAGREIGSLSQGEQRRLALAEQLHELQKTNNQPLVILFDNPSHGLDPISIDRFTKLLKTLTNLGHTIIIADDERLSQSADHIVELN